MPIATKPEEVPADAVDVTDAVNEIHDQLNEIFSDKSVPVIALAIGTAIGCAIDDREDLRRMLKLVAETACQIFDANLMVQAQQEGTIH